MRGSAVFHICNHKGCIAKNKRTPIKQQLQKMVKLPLIDLTISIYWCKYYIIKTPSWNCFCGVHWFIRVRRRGSSRCLHGTESAAPRAGVTQYLPIANYPIYAIITIVTKPRNNRKLWWTMFISGKLNRVSIRTLTKQVCIPVGCIPPACWHIRGGLLRGVCIQGGSASGGVCIREVCIWGGLQPGGSAQPPRSAYREVGVGRPPSPHEQNDTQV